MKRKKHQIINAITLVLSIMLMSTFANAKVKLPRIFSSHMVLQRNMPLPVWGWASPGENVTVTLAGNTATTTANSRGHWQVKLPALKAGGPYAMTVKGANTIKLVDILVGEVWLCSGQSNMEFGMQKLTNAKEEIAAANYPKIRIFEVKKVTSGLPSDHFLATTQWYEKWRLCTPKNIAQGSWEGFSAVGYFFGRYLYKKLNVPVGLIDSSWGGTRIEPWTPPQGFASVPKLNSFVTLIKMANKLYCKQLQPSLDKLQNWINAAHRNCAAGKAVPALSFALPNHPLNGRQKPTGLYNAMIKPMVPFAIRGAIWYQGESNRGDGMMYYYKMQALINGWRKIWNEGDFPFYYVQLAPFRYRGSSTMLPEIWEAQTAALSIPNTGMAITVDIGNIRNIHPTDKQDVGKRLALWALAKTYGYSNIVYSGPLYKSMKIEGNKIRIYFKYTGSGLTTKDGQAPNWFTIAGQDKQFHPAKAVIEGNTVVVSSPDVPHPVAVRYAWSQIAQPNLMNKEKLPASPFRTDKW